MKCRVHYVSPKGSAETIAEAIARTCKCVKEPLLPAYMPENIALMFLGCEGGKPDKVTLEFIKSLNKERVANAALFCCGKDGSALAPMRQALKNRGVNVLELTFTAPVKGLFGGGPSDADLTRAAQFAEDCISQLSREE